jgi:hypothetical protein
MEKNPEFDDIRPYYDDEVATVIKRLLKNPHFKKFMGFFFSENDWKNFKALMETFTNKSDFQQKISKDAVFKIIGKNASGVECEGFENINKNNAYTYISNHRDIVLDASILNASMIAKGFCGTEIAIGDNLLIQPWIEDLVRLNRSFIVKRGVSVRQILDVSRHLSRYIHFAIKDKKQSVWIAQREGRAKNSNDRTQESVLKMLILGGENSSTLQNLEELNITPVSLSYEYDPCDFLKAMEFQQKRDNPEFKKSKRDDLINMQTGLYGYKGHIHFQIGHPINPSLTKIDAALPKNEIITRTAALIDNEIFRNYRIYPINYIAYDRLWGDGSLKNKYTSKDIQVFDAYLQKQLNKINLPNKDIPFLTGKIFEMYAYPLRNYLETKYLL